MPRARSRRFSRASVASACELGERSRRAFGGVPLGELSASRSLTARATSCCWAPSWMFRSSCLARSSCAATIRRRDARSSSISRTLRSTSPAWAARSRTSRSFDGFIGSFGSIRRTARRGPRPGPEPRPRLAGQRRKGVAEEGHRKRDLAPGPPPRAEARSHRSHTRAPCAPPLRPGSGPCGAGRRRAVRAPHAGGELGQHLVGVARPP